MTENLEGKLCLITGATNGIGRSAAIELSKRGAEIAFIARDVEKAQKLFQELSVAGGKVMEPIIANLGSIEETKEAAKVFINRDKDLDILLNNAGIINTERKETVDGFEEVFAVNHLAYFVLTLCLLNGIKNNPKRIVNVSSGAHAFVKDINYQDIEYKENYSTMKVYGQSKLANILFTKELSNKLSSKGTTVNCLHPGFVNTGIGSQNSPTLARVLMTLAKPFSKKSEKGAETSIYLCSSEEVKGVTGEYFVDCKIKSVTEAAKSDNNAKKLWEISRKMTGVDLNG
tara:strand:- start:39100 stop:39960 length:861 start_codon:yes stop_codon:yes gene_type:complete